MPYPVDPLSQLVVGPPLSFRFAVVFFQSAIRPNPIDLRFRSVSGIGSSIKTHPLEKGGQNRSAHSMPDAIQYENLVLERGLLLSSPLANEFEQTLSDFVFSPCNVLVSLLDEAGIAIVSWLFFTAYPVKWTLSRLDAEQNQVVVETMELVYQHLQSIRI